VSAKPWWVDLAKAHVLVEDEFTQALLATAWNDVSVRVEHVGGVGAVRAMGKDARGRKATTVFGVVDRDFAVSAGWTGESQTYRLQRHEAENYLLDFDVLAELARDTSESLMREATSYALRCCPWMAARRTLMEIDHGLNENFPGAPDLGQQPPPSLDAAVALVGSKAFWKGLRKKLKQHWADVALRDLVHQHHGTFEAEVTNGRWAETFSGKEVLRHLGQRFPKLALPEVDLAIRVARQWRARTRIPAELADLLAEIKRRAAR